MFAPLSFFFKKQTTGKNCPSIFQNVKCLSLIVNSFLIFFFSCAFQVWFQNRRMKDKRQRLSINWPCSDPSFAAYVLQAAAAASGYNPYAVPGVAPGFPYPMMGAYNQAAQHPNNPAASPMMAHGQRFTPYPLPDTRPPMFNALNNSPHQSAMLKQSDFNSMSPLLQSTVERQMYPFDLSSSSAAPCVNNKRRFSGESISPPPVKRAAVGVTQSLSPTKKTALFRPFKADS
jgi:hypothetical protein